MQSLKKAKDQIIRPTRMTYNEDYDIPGEIESALGDSFEKNDLVVDSVHHKELGNLTYFSFWESRFL